MTPAAFAAVQLHGVDLVHPLDPGAEVRLGRPDEQMHVVRHEAVGENRPLLVLRAHAHADQVGAAVGVVGEEIQAGHRLRGHVMEAAGQFDTR